MPVHQDPFAFTGHDDGTNAASQRCSTGVRPGLLGDTMWLRLKPAALVRDGFTSVGRKVKARRWAPLGTGLPRVWRCSKCLTARFTVVCAAIRDLEIRVVLRSADIAGTPASVSPDARDEFAQPMGVSGPVGMARSYSNKQQKC